ncbi:MAG: hypothetical protein ACREPJ_10080 [Rhodanobacteraceae bacterium]
MATRNNPKLVARTTPAASGALYIDRQVTNLADPLQVPAHANGDRLQIGVVPAGTKLVPHLCRLAVPKLDTNGSGTGKVKIGTADTADALVAEAAATSAINDLQTSFKAAEIGSATADTPIYLTLSAALATQVTSGSIVFDLALRAWDSKVDG